MYAPPIRPPTEICVVGSDRHEPKRKGPARRWPPRWSSSRLDQRPGFSTRSGFSTRNGLKSLPQIRSRVKRVAAAFAGYRALAVTDDVIGKYVEQRQRDGAAPATINRELEVIGRAFALAKRKLRFTPSIPSLPERNARQGFFDRADFERVLSYIDDADVVDFL